MRSCLAALVVVALAAAARADDRKNAPVDSLRVDLGPVPDFTLQERSGRAVRRDDLKGKVWVAAFFYTCCAGDCPRLNAGMARLQQRLADCPDVRLVSISVHPEQDTAQVLKEYAYDYGADPERWLFLTGDEQAVYHLVRKGFYQGVQRHPGGPQGLDVDHTFNLVVVDRQGNIRGYLDGRTPENLARVEARVRELADESPPPANARTTAPTTTDATPAAPVSVFPAVNATLNGSCGLLLVFGWLAVRSRWITLHKVAMLTALGVSAVFLGCYLYYHFVVKDGQPTTFTGEGWVRPLYLGILLSHTVLAAVVAPLALVTTFFGLRGTIGRHMRLARWTLPLWLYVSVTGVVVYVMLYHLYPAH
jgi:protein SCO1/2/putative membrane protein